MSKTPLQDDIVAELQLQPLTMRQLSERLVAPRESIRISLIPLIDSGRVVHAGWSKPPRPTYLFAIAR